MLALDHGLYTLALKWPHSRQGVNDTFIWSQDVNPAEFTEKDSESVLFLPESSEAYDKGGYIYLNSEHKNSIFSVSNSKFLRNRGLKHSGLTIPVIVKDLWKRGFLGPRTWGVQTAYELFIKRCSIHLETPYEIIKAGFVPTNYKAFIVYDIDFDGNSYDLNITIPKRYNTIPTPVCTVNAISIECKLAGKSLLFNNVAVHSMTNIQIGGLILPSMPARESFELHFLREGEHLHSVKTGLLS